MLYPIIIILIIASGFFLYNEKLLKMRMHNHQEVIRKTEARIKEAFEANKVLAQSSDSFYKQDIKLKFSILTRQVDLLGQISILSGSQN